LKATVIVPTLDTLTPSGKNVIWCSSFQIAWNKLKDGVVKAAVQVKGAEGVAKRLNSATQGEKDLTPESYFAAAGYVKEGICDQIRSAMAQKFPNAPAPTFDAPQDGLVAYAYLAAGVKFELPFFENREELLFKDSGGKETAATSFGIRREDHDAYIKLRSQVRVLYTAHEKNSGQLDEFVVDPCVSSTPNQIILACVKPLATLAETVAGMNDKLAGTQPDMPELTPTETILVPNLRWEITHRFKELEGVDRTLLNKGFEGNYVLAAVQGMKFTLDRSGAELASEAKMIVASKPRHFVFSRPFLIVMRKRGAKEPFFVMWVDNAELLTRW
jgi:hypothetical protein